MAVPGSAAPARPEHDRLCYAVDAKVGAFTYNLAHHKAVAIVVGVAGLFFVNKYLILAGLILFGHSSMDRMLGYGLKYAKGFKFTHLGEVSAQQKPEQKVGVN